MPPSITPHRCEVLIVGAGPVGLALACLLRKLDIDVRLIEKRSGPSVHSKAIGLQYRVSEVLARLGIVDRFIAKGGSPTSVNIYSGLQRLVQLRFVAPSGIAGTGAFQPRAILIPQAETEAILIDYFQELGGRVEWQVEFDSYQALEGIVVAQTKTPAGASEIQASWLVSCEGAHSGIRKQAGITFGGKSYPLAFAMADVRMHGALSHDENHVWVHPDGSVAALPLPSRDTWRLFIEISRQPTAVGQPSLADVKRFVATRAPGMKAEIIGDPLWLSDFRINCRMVDRMHHGRIFLAGDAAHIHSPTGGQGITTGMQDAANLAWKLACVIRGAPATLLDTYDQERLPHAAQVLRETDRTTRIFFAPTWSSRILRDWLVLPLLRSATVQGRMFGKFSQLHTNHRRSSLAVDTRGRWTRKRIRAGDRAPDIVLQQANGTTTTLFALMAAQRPVALFAGDVAGKNLPRFNDLQIDAYELAAHGQTGDFAALYGLSAPFICLIRPDGHIGLIAAPTDVGVVRRYLSELCAPEVIERAFADADIFR